MIHSPIQNTLIMKAKRFETPTPTCDNCAKMSLHLCRDGQLHRFCDEHHRYILDGVPNAVCDLHSFILTIRLKGANQTYWSKTEFTGRGEKGGRV